MSARPPPLIVHVIHHLVTGGLENGLVNLINHLPADQFRHAIVCIEDYSDFRLRITRSDVDVIALHRSRQGLWRTRWALFRLCRRLRPAVVHSRNQSGLDALLPARLAGVPACIHGEHGWDVDNLDGARRKPALLRRLHAPLVSHYITVSAHLKDYLVARVGIAAARISQVYNGVDIGRFAPRAAASARSLLPPEFAAEGVLVFGTVGRLQPVKDQACLLRAFALLRASGAAGAERARLAIIGDGPLAASLRALADELGVAGQTWFAGAQSAVAPLLRELDVFVLPSLSEGISNTILEAMASGLPVLATGVGGNVELVEDGSSGRLFAAGDAAGLAALMGDYLADRALLQRHGAAARARAEQRFSLQAMMTHYQAVYARFTGAPRP